MPFHCLSTAFLLPFLDPPPPFHRLSLTLPLPSRRRRYGADYSPAFNAELRFEISELREVHPFDQRLMPLVVVLQREGEKTRPFLALLL